MRLAGVRIPRRDARTIGDEDPPRRRADDVHRRAVILFMLAVTFTTALSWKGERDSCIRNSAIRAGFNDTVTIQRRSLETSLKRARVSVANPEVDAQTRAGAAEAIRQYKDLLGAQRTVRTLDCGGLFPDAD